MFGSLRAGSDSVYARDKLLAVGVQSVLANFERYGVPHKQVRPVIGYFASSMPKLREELIARGERLAILRLDGDMYDSTVDVLYNLYDLLLPGGYLVVDDFGWPYRERELSYGARDAILDFRHLHGIEDADHAMPDIDGAAVWWTKAREVDLRRDNYLASLRGRNASDTLTTARKRNSELLTVLGPTNWRSASRNLIDLGKKWRESWSPREREEAEAVTDTPECPDGMSLTLSCQAKLKASRR